MKREMGKSHHADSAYRQVPAPEPLEWSPWGGFGCSSRGPARDVFLVWIPIFSYGGLSRGPAGIALMNFIVLKCVT